MGVFTPSQRASGCRKGGKSPIFRAFDGRRRGITGWNRNPARGLPTARTILADHDARCGNVHTFPATGRPTATGVAGSRQGPEVRAAVSRGTASRRGEGSGGTAEGKGDTPAQRPEPGRGGRPQGRRTFGSVKSSTALLLEKVAKAQMFVYSAAEKESAWKD